MPDMAKSPFFLFFRYFGQFSKSVDFSIYLFFATLRQLYLDVIPKTDFSTFYLFGDHRAAATACSVIKKILILLTNMTTMVMAPSIWAFFILTMNTSPPPLSWGLFFITMTTNRVSKLRGLELQSWYGCHVIKTWLQLVCCALVQEPGCLAILGGHQQTLIFGHNKP